MKTERGRGKFIRETKSTKSSLWCLMLSEQNCGILSVDKNSISKVRHWISILALLSPHIWISVEYVHTFSLKPEPELLSQGELGHRQVHFPRSPKKLYGRNVKQTILRKRKSCKSCHWIELWKQNNHTEFESSKLMETFEFAMMI